MVTSNNNNNLVKNLINLSHTDNLSHAYLFYGEAKDEMKSQALALAKKLETGELGTGSSSRTPILIDATIFDAENTSSLGIDIVREIKNYISQKPLKSKKRTVIVLGAQELTREAQNAILKILEDAPQSALIILIATSIERLLPTIISRLQKIYISINKELNDLTKIVPNQRIKELADKFLKADSTTRRTLVKEITDEEKDGSVNLSILFVDALIMLLSQKPEENGPFLKELLYRRRVLGEYSLNKRLQLAYLSNLWYN
ncbi:MAG: hypothetical protein Q8L47_01150 [bacterium]|nr:hypothetical protein [bacterium]